MSETFKANIYYGGEMEINDTKVSYIGGAWEEDIQVDPDFMTWTVFDDFCKKHEVGGSVGKVWYKLRDEDMESVKSIAYLSSDAELMQMCAEAMSRGGEIDIFIQQAENGSQRKSEKSDAAESDENQTRTDDDEIENQTEMGDAEADENQTEIGDTEADGNHESEKDEAENVEGTDPKKKEPEKKRKRAMVLENEVDIGERYEVEIEEAVENFVDEEEVLTSVIPDSWENEQEDDLVVIPDSWENEQEEEPQTWTLAFYKLVSYCDNVENNSTESFNSSISLARGKALIPMLETIRRLAMVRNTKRNKKSERWTGRYSKYVQLVLADEKKNAEKCSVTPATHGRYEVELFSQKHYVNLKNKTCTCVKWQISGIPCEHAYGAIMDQGFDTDDYGNECFSTTKWRDCYSDNLEPMRGPSFWMHSGFYRLVTAPPEPETPGRKKTKKIRKRVKGKFESPKKKKVQKLGKEGRVIHCSKCGVAGHNAAGCKIHPKKKMRMTKEASDQGTTSSQGGESGAQVLSQGHDTMALTQPSQVSD